MAWVDGKTYSAPTAELDVVDRVGGGDGFAAGFIYGLLAGEPPEEAIKLGWAHGALLTTLPRRHDHGDAGAGEGVCQGRIGAHSAVKKYNPNPAGDIKYKETCRQGVVCLD